MPRSLARTLAASFAALALATLASCGDDASDDPAGTTTTAASLDVKQVEQAIKSSVREQRGVSATVTCPKVVRQAKDVNFVCLVKTKKFGTSRFAVVQTNDRGDVQYSAEEK